MDAIIATDERFVSDKARPPPLHRGMEKRRACCGYQMRSPIAYCLILSVQISLYPNLNHGPVCVLEDWFAPLRECYTAHRLEAHEFVTSISSEPRIGCRTIAACRASFATATR